MHGVDEVHCDHGQLRGEDFAGRVSAMHEPALLASTGMAVPMLRLWLSAAGAPQLHSVLGLCSDDATISCAGRLAVLPNVQQEALRLAPLALLRVILKPAL